MGSSRRIPILIVSGFLGSGKTTLVSRLLAQARSEGVRVAVISNEFGALGIDAALLGGAGADYVEIEGGCVCCELSDELIETLEMLRARVDPDRIVIEISGVALPHDTQLHLWREPVASWRGEDLALVVVNAEQVHAGRELSGTFEDQVSSADLLVLNKIDLVPGTALPGIEARVRELEPDAPILSCVRGELDSALLFPPEPGRIPERDRAKRSARPHRHEAFEAEEIQVPDGIEPEALLARIRALAPLRAKGFVRTTRGIEILQGVAGRLELTGAGAAPPEGRIGRVVLIRRV
ncbi:MAG: CobW family GTP-binding protein [Myxococcota bacterium]|nr:CobW family GTP-binding protein [Myxococcota bacterium]